MDSADYDDAVSMADEQRVEGHGLNSIGRLLVGAFVLALVSEAVYFIGAVNDWPWFVLALALLVIAVCVGVLLLARPTRA